MQDVGGVVLGGSQHRRGRECLQEEGRQQDDERTLPGNCLCLGHERPFGLRSHHSGSATEAANAQQNSESHECCHCDGHDEIAKSLTTERVTNQWRNSTAEQDGHGEKHDASAHQNRSLWRRLGYLG